MLWRGGANGGTLSQVALGYGTGVPGRNVEAPAELPSADPASLGFDADRLKRIDGAIDRAIERKQVPGAVVLVGRRGAIAYALRGRASRRRPHSRADDTRYGLRHGLAHQAGRHGHVDHDPRRGREAPADRSARSCAPAFDNHGKGAITIDQLLRHRAGLIPDNPIADYQQGPESAWKRTRRSRSRRPARGAVSLFRRGFRDPGIAGRENRRPTSRRLREGSDLRRARDEGRPLPSARPGRSVERQSPTGSHRADRAGIARGPDAPGSRPRSAVEGAGRGRRTRGPLRLGRRPGDLRPDAPQWRDRSQRPSHPLAADREGDDRRRCDAEG